MFPIHKCYFFLIIINWTKKIWLIRKKRLNHIKSETIFCQEISSMLTLSIRSISNRKTIIVKVAEVPHSTMKNHTIKCDK
jgi:hypothetical protein